MSASIPSHHPAMLQIQPGIEARDSKRLIQDWLGTTISSFCYPFYWSHAFLANDVKRAAYEQARGGARASYYLPSMAASIDRFNVDCRQISPAGENAHDWVRDGCWHVLTYHAIGGTQDGWMPITVDQFSAQMEELATLCASGAVEVVTFKDGAARFVSQS